MTVNGRSFGLKNENACIFGRKNKDQYMIYQNNYREQYGVFPELDLKNNPFSALWDDAYLLYTGLKARGFYGAWFWHDDHGHFNKRLKTMYHTYKREWSFLGSINLSYRTLFEEVPAMPPQERIIDSLGYRKDEDGNYYEGTWDNGELIYGLMYLAKQNIFCVGRFRNGMVREFHGVTINLGVNQKKTGNVTTSIGIFKADGDELTLYRDLSLTVVASCKNGDMKSIDATVGKYDGGYETGRFYTKSVYSNDDIKIGWDRYKDGEVVKSSGGIFDILLHFVLGMYMTAYFMMKFTYGLLIWPIYRAIQKKNWR